MITTRKQFSDMTGLSCYLVAIAFDRLCVKQVDDFTYNVSWFDLQNIKDFLTNRKSKRSKDYTNYNNAIKKIDKLCEEM